MIVRYKIQGAGLSVAQIQAGLPAGGPPPFIVSAAVTAPPGFFDVTVAPDLDAAAHADLDDYMLSVGLVFVEDNPTTPLCPIEVRFSVPYDNDKGDYAVHHIAAGSTGFFSFRIPSDFVSLNKLVMVAIPNNTTVDKDIELSSDYGAIGEPYNSHSESNATLLWSATAGELIEFDISSVFSALSAGDNCGLFINQNGITGGVNYLCILLQYSNVP